MAKKKNLKSEKLKFYKSSMQSYDMINNFALSKIRPKQDEN